MILFNISVEPNGDLKTDGETQIYPNPATDKITIVAPSNASIVISDMQG